MNTASPTTDFLDELSWRGLVSQVTHEQQLRDHLRAGRHRAYVGFDPTADSLTIGNLVGIMVLLRFARAGHEPVVVIGGGTGLIGDPSGKSAERQLLTPERVEANVAGQRRIFDALWGNAGLGTPPLRNNNDWLGGLGYLEVLRDVGKFFSVNMMIQKESVKERLHNRDQGISYTEFSYMILQAYDFLHLWREEGVTLQMGGSDQFGNIVCGIDLIRRDQPDGAAPGAFGLTWPLVTKADGGKFGKTESGAIWLTADRTSPYAFYQFWLNAADADVVRFLNFFTLMSREEVAALAQSHGANPGAREAHRALARHMTTLLHGASECENAEKAAKALFSGDIAGLSAALLEEVMANVPSSTLPRVRLDGAGIPLIDLLVETSLAQSKREAREFLSGGSVVMNGRKVGDADAARTSDLLHGTMIALRRGKKNWHLLRFA